MEEEKLCECGCGNPVPIAKITSSRKGHIKGKPVRFVLGHATRRPIKERFWSKVDIRGENDCWIWKASTNSNGYGHIVLSGKFHDAHKLAFILSGGVLTEEKDCVLHKCDNPSCVNPAHLFAGSHTDNTKDMYKKGRHVFTKVISEEKRKEVKQIQKSGIGLKQIGIRFGISISTVRRILKTG